MKDLIITKITDENYTSVVKKIEKVFPKVRWISGGEKPHIVKYKTITTDMPTDSYNGLCIEIDKDELSYINYKHAKYRVNVNEEYMLTAKQFLHRNILNLSIGHLI